jgi:hypothetical protein
VKPNGIEERLEHSVTRAIDWVRAHKYCAYEPADGNASLLFPLTFGKVLPMRVLQQVVLRSPINIRPLLGIRPHESSIGRGYLAWAYVLLSRQGIDSARVREEAVACLRWLMANNADGYDRLCWGDPYEYATRSGRRRRSEPLLIWSALIGQAFLDAFDTLGDETFRRAAGRVGDWMMRLPVERTDRGCCLSYVPSRQSSIHNSNAMGAAFLARLGAAGVDRARALASDVMLYTCARQRSDGSWWYAEDPKYRWIDNFHTGYILSAIKVYRAAAGDQSFDEHMVRGTEYFLTHFFESDGRPKYFHDRTYPIDIQCAAQAIDTLASLADFDSRCLPQAIKVAEWTLARMQADDGHFVYRDLGWRLVSTPMLHWGQGTMIKALAVLRGALVPRPA